MTRETHPPLSGTVTIPGDKSISHRSLMLGALAVGKTTVKGLLEGEDVLHTADAMRAMGAQIERHSNGTWDIHGVGIGGLTSPKDTIYMGNSGTSARLLMGLIGGHPITVRMDGDASLTKRPMNRVIKPLQTMGASFEVSEGGRLPLTIHGADPAIHTCYELPVASAQVKSAILLAGLNARGQTTVIEIKPTRDHTENMLRGFGVPIESEIAADGKYHIHVQGQYDLTPCDITVPSDPSSAAFPAAAALLIEGSDITLPNIGMSDRRAGIYTTLREMGADIDIQNQRVLAGEKIADLRIQGTGPLKGIKIPPARVPSMIDEFPILAMIAACADGTTHMSGLEELRVKESDRLLMVAEGLKSCGVDLEMGEDTLTIHGNGKPPHGSATIQTALDHRIAMSFLVLGLVTDAPVKIDDATPIKTSFPNFFNLMNTLGANITP